MANIKWNSELNKQAGFFKPEDVPGSVLSPTDKNTLLHLIWSLTYTTEGRNILKDNRPYQGVGGKPGPTPEQAERNVRQWIADKFTIQDETLVNAIIAAHFAADAWIEAKRQENPAGQATQQKIYQQNVAVVTWMLWEDAMAHEFSMNW